MIIRELRDQIKEADHYIATGPDGALKNILRDWSVYFKDKLFDLESQELDESLIVKGRD